MVFVPTPNPPDYPDIASSRCGVQRQSMRTNVLIHQTGLGEVNKTTFASPGSDTIFGVPKKPDMEGARELTTIWKEHRPNPDDVPGPDFREMNKLAAVKGLTTATEQPGFRATHYICLKNGHAVRKPPPLLPSDVDRTFVYGMPGTHRTAEQIRNAGPYDPPAKPLIQNQYAADWKKMNTARAHVFDTRSHYIPPRPTRASRGHMAGSIVSRQRTSGIPPEGHHEPFKLSKFTKHAAPKVTQYIRSGKPAEATISTEPAEAAAQPEAHPATEPAAEAS